MKKIDNGSTAKSFIVLTAFSLFEKIVAFIYQIVMAKILGTSSTTDVYYSASQLFDLIDVTVLGAIVIVLLNRFSAIEVESGTGEGINFLSRENTFFTIVICVITVLVFVFAKPLSFLIGPGYSAADRILLIKSIRIICVVPIVTVLATVCQALLRAKRCFLAVNSRSLCISMVGMLTILLFSEKARGNPAVLCIGYVLSNILYTLILYFRSIPFGKVKLLPIHHDTEIKNVIKTATPLIIGNGIVRLGIMIDQVIATTIGEGAVSCQTYAATLYQVVFTLLISGLCMVLMTDFSDLCIQKKYEEMVSKLRTATKSITLLLGPISVLAVVFSVRIVAIIYERGAFNHDASIAVGELLAFYSIGFIPALLTNVYSQVLYAFGKAKESMIYSAVSVFVNIIFSLILIKFVGLVGVAIATTFSTIIVIPLYKRTVTKDLPEYTYIFPFSYICKVGIGLILCAAVAIAVKIMIDSAFLSFIIATLSGFVVYAVTLFVTREETTMSLYRSVMEKLKAGKANK